MIGGWSGDRNPKLDVEKIRARAQDAVSFLEIASRHLPASLGKLAAVVAHEINNPLSSVVTYAKIMLRRLAGKEESQENAQVSQYLESIASEASRCGEIVAQLLSFARQRGGATDAKTEWDIGWKMGVGQGPEELRNRRKNRRLVSNDFLQNVLRRMQRLDKHNRASHA